MTKAELINDVIDALVELGIVQFEDELEPANDQTSDS